MMRSVDVVQVRPRPTIEGSRTNAKRVMIGSWKPRRIAPELNRQGRQEHKKNPTKKPECGEFDRVHSFLHVSWRAWRAWRFNSGKANWTVSHDGV